LAVFGPGITKSQKLACLIPRVQARPITVIASTEEAGAVPSQFQANNEGCWQLALAKNLRFGLTTGLLMSVTAIASTPSSKYLPDERRDVGSWIW